MSDQTRMPAEDARVLDVMRHQLQHFQEADPRCRALQLPEGLMLRYTLSQALYFYLRTGVAEGQLRTRVYASDSPYDRCKADVGEVLTPMFEAVADRVHLDKLERLLRSWVDFVKEDVGLEEGDFKSFPVGPQDN